MHGRRGMFEKNLTDLSQKLDDLAEGSLYTISLPGVSSVSGKPLLGEKVYYTLVKRR